MIRGELEIFIDFRFLHVCFQSRKKVSKFSGMLEKMERGVERLLSVSKLKRSSILAKYIRIFFFINKNKSSLSTPLFIFSTIFQILVTTFYIFLNTFLNVLTVLNVHWTMIKNLFSTRKLIIMFILRALQI